MVGKYWKQPASSVANDTLWLCINDDYMDNNKGTVDVEIDVDDFMNPLDARHVANLRAYYKLG